MIGRTSARGRLIRLAISVLLALIVFGVAIWQGIPTGGKADTSRLLVSALLTALGLAQLGAAAWGFALWRREETIRTRQPGALVQTCLVTAETRDALRRDRASGPAIRLSCCLVVDRDGIALVTSSAASAPSRLVPWSRIRAVGWGTQEGDTKIPNAVTFDTSEPGGPRLSFIPVGRGFFALNPLAPAAAQEFFDELRARRTGTAELG